MGLKAYIVKVTVRGELTVSHEVRATGKQNARVKALRAFPPTYQANAGEVILIKGKGRYV